MNGYGRDDADTESLIKAGIICGSMIDDFVEREGQSTSVLGRGEHETRAPPESPRALYHGTVQDYLEWQGRQGRRCIQGGIHLTTDKYIAMGFALKRAREYDDIGVVLVVDSRRLPHRPERLCKNHLVSRSLPDYAFMNIVVQKKADGGCDYVRWADAIQYWARRIADIPKQELERNNDIIFGSLKVSDCGIGTTYRL